MSQADSVAAEAISKPAAYANPLATSLSTDVLIGVALATLWALAHSFFGIDGDSRIYIGRALADIDPSGVGRDMMFVMDGQSSFTVFRLIARMLASAFGLGPAVFVLSLVNLVAWFAAVVVFVRAVVPGRAAALVLAVVFVLPRLYTGWHLLSAGESVPVPRPLAEAGVLLALAALCRGRTLACVAWLVVAALFHPIMAAPGFGVLLVVLGLRDRRWLFAAAALAACVVCAGFLGLPVASRLAATIDPAWRAVLISRNPYLFVGKWPVTTLGPLLVQAVTIVIACRFLEGRVRVIMLAALGIGIVGVLSSMLFGDLLSDLLIVQAQVWRALWLPAVIGPVAAGLNLLRLPSRGVAGQVALPCLALAWVALDWFPLAPLAALLAMAALFGVPRLSFSLGRNAVVGVWIICAGFALVAEWGAFSALIQVKRALPADVPLTWGTIWALRVPALPSMLLFVAWWRWQQARATKIAAALAVFAGFGLLATHWDSRGPGQADVDAAVREPDLVAMLASRPGPVLWTEGDGAWDWIGRANWNAPIQGSAIVFSRALALEWRARAEAVVQAGLATENLLAPLDIALPLEAPTLDSTKIGRLCARPDAPAWIIAPLASGAAVPADLKAPIWSPRVAPGKFLSDAKGIHWRRFDRYAVVPCAYGAARP